MQFLKDYDVAVVGGGIAGAAAALAAARAGSKTVLLEKTVLLGGLATAGLVYIYLPLCDGHGKQVTFGISEEFIKLSLKYGPGDIPENWKNEKNAEERKRYCSIFSPASMVLTLDELLTDAGVDIWLDTLVCDAEITDDNRLRAVIVENESGRGSISARCFIDASGTAIVARRAGAEVEYGMNTLAMWALEYNPELEHFRTMGKHLNMFQGGLMSGNESSAGKYNCINGRKVTDFILEGRRMLMQRYSDKYASGSLNRKTFFPVKLPAMPQFRKIARIVGQQTLRDNQYGTHFRDSVGMVADWHKPGYVWEIPYGTLLPQKLKGLLAAGRCTAAAGYSWEITRVIPAAAMTGEVAGIAAAMSAKREITPDQLDITDLQGELRKRGFPLHLKDIDLD